MAPQEAYFDVLGFATPTSCSPADHYLDVIAGAVVTPDFNAGTLGEVWQQQVEAVREATGQERGVVLHAFVRQSALSAAHAHLELTSPLTRLLQSPGHNRRAEARSPLHSPAPPLPLSPLAEAVRLQRLTSGRLHQVCTELPYPRVPARACVQSRKSRR